MGVSGLESFDSFKKEFHAVKEDLFGLKWFYSLIKSETEFNAKGAEALLKSYFRHKKILSPVGLLTGFLVDASGLISTPTHELGHLIAGQGYFKIQKEELRKLGVPEDKIKEEYIQADSVDNFIKFLEDLFQGKPNSEVAGSFYDFFMGFDSNEDGWGGGCHYPYSTDPDLQLPVSFYEETEPLRFLTTLGGPLSDLIITLGLLYRFSRKNKKKEETGFFNVGLAASYARGAIYYAYEDFKDLGSGGDYNTLAEFTKIPIKSIADFQKNFYYLSFGLVTGLFISHLIRSRCKANLGSALSLGVISKDDIYSTAYMQSHILKKKYNIRKKSEKIFKKIDKSKKNSEEGYINKEDTKKILKKIKKLKKYFDDNDYQNTIMKHSIWIYRDKELREKIKKGKLEKFGLIPFYFASLPANCSWLTYRRRKKYVSNPLPFVNKMWKWCKYEKNYNKLYSRSDLVSVGKSSWRERTRMLDLLPDEYRHILKEQFKDVKILKKGAKFMKKMARILGVDEETSYRLGQRVIRGGDLNKLLFFLGQQKKYPIQKYGAYTPPEQYVSQIPQMLYYIKSK